MIQLEEVLITRGAFTLRAHFSIAAGRLCAVLGPSGAGKTTLLNVIAGFEPLDYGRLLIDGQDQSANTPARRPISMVFQDHNVFPHLDLWRNVALGVKANLRLDEGEKQRVDEALKRVGLSALARRKPSDVSGGERQRVALARMLVRNSKLLLLDEPFAALDPGLRAEMLHEVATIAEEGHLSVLLVTHQPEEIRHKVNDILFIVKGEIQGPVTAERFFRSKDAAICTYLGKARL